MSFNPINPHSTGPVFKLDDKEKKHSSHLCSGKQASNKISDQLAKNVLNQPLGQSTGLEGAHKFSPNSTGTAFKRAPDNNIRSGTTLPTGNVFKKT